MMLTATNLDRPAFNTISKTSQQCQKPKDIRPSNTPSITKPATSYLTTVETTQDITLKPLAANRHEALLQMQRRDPFCKCISKQLSNGKAPQHEADLFTHIKWLLYKHVMDANHKFLAPIIPKAWKYTVLVEAHDKFGNQGVSHTYCLIKCQYYWKGINKDIHKYIANSTLCQWEKANVKSYPLQMTEYWRHNSIKFWLTW